jgi:hypothetical protein
MVLLVYCRKITPRVTYIFDFLLNGIGGIEFRITDNQREYELAAGPSLNYSHQRLKTSEVFYVPETLLFEDDVTQQNITINVLEGSPYLYFKQGVSKNLFDPFAASFFLISRYEEYLPFVPDKHGRFEANSSCLYSAGLFQTPLVNVWGEDIRNNILKSFPLVKTIDQKFSGFISVDVDQAYAFKYRGFHRNLITLVTNTTRRRSGFLSSQVKTLLKKSNDPYDTFEYLRRRQKESGIQFIYFINVGDYSEYDKNVPLTNFFF